MNRVFHFKQFSVADDRCAMKVGTDGVLLAAWSLRASEKVPSRILDIGTGCGVIALIAAQRFPETAITAIEVDQDASRQAGENFRASYWADRLENLHISLQEFALNIKESLGFDLILCNPPFFPHRHNYPPRGLQRQMARSDGHLNMEDLMKCSGELLSPEGSLCLILPVENCENLVNLAISSGLQPVRQTLVCPTEGKVPHRILTEWRRSGSMTVEAEAEVIVIQKSTSRNDFTNAYKDLVKDLYTIL